MAWISYYKGLAIALVAVLAPVYHVSLDVTRASSVHSTHPHKPAPGCCIASMQRRCTAATGE